MKKLILNLKFIVAFLLIPTLSNAQFGVELNYGMNGSYEPSYSGFTHFGGGLSYDLNETFAAKVDFASDKFSIENELGDKTGTKNTRISLQGVINLSELMNKGSNYNDFIISAHGGAGLSILKSDIAENTGTDHILNIIVGLNPKYKVTDGLFLGIDASLIANISQHYNFDGTPTYTGAANSITGLMYNLSATVLYKFGNY